MLNSIVEQYVNDAVGDLIKASAEFTAYDLTKSARQEFGRGTMIQHDDVRDVVHNMYHNGQMPGYGRTNKAVGNSGAVAWVYAPLAQSAQSSVPTGVVAPPVAKGGDGFLSPADLAARYGGTSAVTATTALVTPSTPTASAPQGESKTVDPRNRLRIPKHILDEAGFKSGDDAWVTFDKATGGLSITKAPAADARHFKVDSYGNIRIGLAKVGIATKVFELDVNNDTVLAKPL